VNVEPITRTLRAVARGWAGAPSFDLAGVLLINQKSAGRPPPALADVIFAKQPNLLASCLVQPRLGVGPQSVEFLLNILFVCFQAMKESGLDWPL
jgi:hypothetical protein